MIKLFQRLRMVCYIAISAVMLAACSDDGGDEKILQPLFEEPLKINCNVGDIKELEFNSSESWKLSSSAIWCRLSDDGENFAYDVTGIPGNNKVYIAVNGEAQEFAETVAQIYLFRGAMKEHVATVYRSPNAYKLSLADDAGNICDTINIASKGFTSFSVDANFEFGVSEIPEWLSKFSVTPDDKVKNRKSFYVSVDEAVEPFPCSAILEFINADSTVSFPYVINYTGMDSLKVKIDGENPWGWSLSSDGGIFSCNNAISGKEIVYAGSVPYTVKTYNYDCRYICLQENGDKLTLMPLEVSWLKVHIDDNDASKIQISGEPYPVETEGERKGYVVAVPAASYDGFIAMYNDVQNLSLIDSVYNNVLIEVTQKSDYVDLSKGFTVLRNMYEPLDCFEESDESYLALLNETFGVNDVFAVSVESGAHISAFPHLTDRHWEGWNSNNTLVLDADGNEIDKSAIDFEVGMDVQENYYISVTAQIKPIIIVLRGVNGDYLKALVVKSGITLDPGTGFDVKYKMIEDVECNLETDMELAASIIERYGTKEIYSVKSRVGRTLQIFPHLTDEVWGGGTLGSTLAFDTEGNALELADVDFETAMDAEDNYYVSSMVKKKVYMLVFVGLNGENIKVIVIKPNS